MHEDLVKRLKSLATLEVKNGESVLHVTAEATAAIREIAQEAANAIEELQKLTDAQLDIIKQYQVYPTKQRWISVTERLPSDEKEYLAYYGFVLDGEMSEIRFIGTVEYFAFDNPPHWQHEDIGLIVTHWMPLPKPPEEVKK